LYKLCECVELEVVARGDRAFAMGKAEGKRSGPADLSVRGSEELASIRERSELSVVMIVTYRTESGCNESRGLAIPARFVTDVRAMRGRVPFSKTRNVFEK
jgi:hypothetical protein